MRKLKKLPKFKNSDEEKYFWKTHDSTEYLNWDQAKKAQLPNLKPSTRLISLRLPEGLLNEIKILAHKEDVPYQSLMKILLAQGVQGIRN
jgi:predicted DNA binding CopG/RHH family protein